MQETGEDMALDPQRQHARLLGLSAQGVKVWRRIRHWEANTGRCVADAATVPSEQWLVLIRYLLNHRLVPVVSPGGEPLVFIDPGEDRAQPLALVQIDSGYPLTALGRYVPIDFRPGAPAVRLDHGAILQLGTVARMGPRLWQGIWRNWETLTQMDAFSVEGIDQGLVWLAAVEREGRRILNQPPAIQLTLVTLWRHRGQWFPVSHQDVEALRRCTWLTWRDGSVAWPDSRMKTVST